MCLSPEHSCYMGYGVYVQLYRNTCRAADEKRNATAVWGLRSVVGTVEVDGRAWLRGPCSGCRGTGCTCSRETESRGRTGPAHALVVVRGAGDIVTCKS